MRRFFHRAGRERATAALAGVAFALSGCAADDGASPAAVCTVPPCPAGAGGGGGGGAGAQGGAGYSGGASAGGAPWNAGGAANGVGGTPLGSGNAPGAGGEPPDANAGGASSGGAPGAGGRLEPIPDLTLVVDAPANGARVDGTVEVRGRAPGFRNIEIWDDTHQSPPLAQATPASDGAFTASVNTASLARGATTWTVYAWDSPPGEAFTNTADVALDLTLGEASGDPCAGQSCSGHGTCVAPGGQASCDCADGYHASGLSCVPDSTGEGTPDPGTSLVPSGGYQLIFGDEFSSGSLDTGKWNTLAPYGVQFYADSHQKQAFVGEAVSLANGVVTFTASRSQGNTNGQPYASGSLTTNRSFTYGYFEARTRVPSGKGFWPAYWLTSSSRWPPEWDIFEIIDGVIFGYTHPVSGGKCQFVDGAAGGDFTTYTMPNLYDIYHVYGFEWTPTDLRWWVDGVLTEHYSVNAAAGADDPFWLNISLQVGGDWPGDPNGSTVFPNHMDVDYVRVYQK